MKSLNPDYEFPVDGGVPGPVEVERALNRLTILPNPADPALDDPEKFVESPWALRPVPTVDPNVWSDAELELVDIEGLFATDPWLKRKNVRKHIENMGQAILPYRGYAMVAVVKGENIIIDGHHRLAAKWLLGQGTAPVWKVEL